MARPVALSAHGLSALERLSDAILADDHNRWFPAATHLADVLDQDHALNLAGLCQMLWNRTASVAMLDWASILRPGRSLVTVATPQEYDPVASPGWAADEITRIVQDSNSLGEALDAYLERFGHLPLAPPFSAGSVVKRWLDGRSEASAAWGAIWAWAGHPSNPARRHHACRIFLEHPSLVPTENRATFWDELATSLQSSQLFASDEPDGRSWSLRTDMARLYLLQFESNFPGLNHDQAARLSWWLACRCAARLEEPGPGRTLRNDFLAFIHKNLVSREYSNELTLTRLGLGSTGLSTLGFATVYGGCPWALSLLTAIGQGDSPLDPASASNKAKEDISKSLYQHLILGFPASSEASRPGSFAFEAPLAPAATFWAGHEPDEEGGPSLAMLFEDHARLASPEGLVDRLQNLPSQEQRERVIFVSVFAGMAHCGELPADRVLEVISDFGWFRRAMTELTDYEVLRFVDALIAAQRRFMGDWSAALPRLLSAAADLEGISGDRQRFLVQNVLFACAAGRTTSAVRRLSQGTKRWRHSVLLEDLRRTIEGYVPLATPWVASHLRDLLASLPASTGSIKLPKPSPV